MPPAADFMDHFPLSPSSFFVKRTHCVAVKNKKRKTQNQEVCDQKKLWSLPDSATDESLVHTSMVDDGQCWAKYHGRMIGEYDFEPVPMNFDRSTIHVVDRITQLSGEITTFCNDYILLLKKLLTDDEQSRSAFENVAVKIMSTSTEARSADSFFRQKNPSAEDLSASTLTSRGKRLRQEDIVFNYGSSTDEETKRNLVSMCSSATESRSTASSSPTRSDNDGESNHRPHLAQGRPEESVSNMGEVATKARLPSHNVEGSEATIYPYQNKKWMERYDDLLEYKKQYGHCHVPFHFKGNPSLSQWVKRQRHQHKLFDAGKHSHLNSERIQLLEGIGFTWDSHSAAWEENFQALNEFKDQFGHCHVPIANSRLSTWVKRQRRQYKRYISNQSSTMTEERIQRLSDLGFVWRVRG